MCLTGCERLCAEARFLAKLETMPNGCRVWRGALSRGGGRSGSGPYGSFRVNRQLVVRAHVFAAYIAGKIADLRSPPGCHLDHYCEHATLCVDCVEVVTAEENLKRRWTRPLPKTDVAYRTKKKRRGKRSKPVRVTRKSLPRAKKEVDLNG